MLSRIAYKCALLCCVLLVGHSGLAQGVNVYVVSPSSSNLCSLDVIGGATKSCLPIVVPGRTIVGSHGLARDPQTGTIYALVQFADSDPGIRTLISLDLQTGSAQEIGPVDDGSGLTVGAITFSSSGTMFGVTDRESSSRPSTVFTIDKNTGNAALLVELPFSDVGQGLAYDPHDGRMYRITGFSDLVLESFELASPTPAVNDITLAYQEIQPTSLFYLNKKYFLFSAASGDLYLLNESTATVTYISSPGVASGIVAVPAGSCPPNKALYGTGPLEGPQFLHAIDPAAGSSSFIGPVGFNDITGIDFAPDGVLYAVGTRDDNSGVRVLLTIDLCSGEGTEVGPTDASLRELAITGDGRAFTYSGSVLSELALNLGTVNAIGDSNIVADDFGIEYSLADSKFYFARILDGIGDLFTINLLTGESAVESQLSLPPNISAIRGFDFDAAHNQMYGLVAEGGTGTPTYLSVLDTSAHTLSLVASTSSNMRTLAFRSGSAESYLLTVIKEGDGEGSISSSPAAIDCGTVCGASFSPGAQVTLTATPLAGAYFIGWSGACTGRDACVTTMDAMRTVRAAFQAPPRFTLSVSKNGTGDGQVVSDVSGIECGSACSATFPVDTAVTLKAMPSAGSSFAGWTGACIGTVSCQLSMSTDRSVTATFNQLPTFLLAVHVTSAGAGVVTGGDMVCSNATCSSSFAQGTALTLSASANPEWIFTGWSGACTGTGACSVTMNSAKDVTANFSFIGPFQFAANAPAPVTVNAGQAAVFNIALQQHPANNSTISLSCSGLPFGTGCSFNPNNIAVTAGTNSTISTQLTISTTAPTFALAKPNGGSMFLAIGIMATVITCCRRRRTGLVAAVSLCLLLLPSCGGGGAGGQAGPVTKVSQSGTPAGTYAITVTGTAAATTQSTMVTLIVK